MDDASDLIEEAEREAGCRWDDPNNPNGLAAVIGAVAREMGKARMGPMAQHPRTMLDTSRDDVALGRLLMHQMSPEGRREQEAKDLMLAMLTAGVSPDDLHTLFGK